MGSLGRYTTYAGAKTAAHKMLAKLFAGTSANPAPFAACDPPPFTTTTAQAVVQAFAVAPVDTSGVGGIIPSSGPQQGDTQMFSTGVDLTFAGGTAGTAPDGSPMVPDVSTVAWKSPGDPANPYFPDPTSPGPGNPYQETNPGIPWTGTNSIEEAIAFTSDGSIVSALADDAAGSNVLNPVTTGPVIGADGAPGTAQTLGKSGIGPTT